MNVRSSESIPKSFNGQMAGTDISPPKIKTIKIVENPFDDIVPRITAAEKKEQAKARAEAKVEMDKRDKRAKAKK